MPSRKTNRINLDLRVGDAFFARLEAWRLSQSGPPSLTAALLHLIDLGLDAAVSRDYRPVRRIPRKTTKTLEPLPEPPVTHWTPARKAAVLLAVTTSQLTSAEACRRYGLSEAAIAAWFDPLPQPPVTRWTPGRKAAVLLALTASQLTIAEVCRRYELSEGELAAWFAALKRFGPAGLRTTQLQQLHSRPKRQRAAAPAP